MPYDQQYAKSVQSAMEEIIDEEGGSSRMIFEEQMSDALGEENDDKEGVTNVAETEHTMPRGKRESPVDECIDEEFELISAEELSFEQS